MPADQAVSKLPLAEFHHRIASELALLNSQFRYFSASTAFSDEDRRDYIEDPIAAIPASALLLLPKVTLLLVPFLERSNGAGKNGSLDLVGFEAPPEVKSILSVQWQDGDGAILAFAVEQLELADYHYELYHQLAWLIGESCPPELLQDYYGLLREELNTHVHGEVDDESWQRKQALLRRATHIRRDTKAFVDYARESLTDTLTLYLHGICCDIDVEPGPRQIASRHLRRRLRLLLGMFPPPAGYAVFPEELDQLAEGKQTALQRSKDGV